MVLRGTQNLRRESIRAAQQPGRIRRKAIDPTGECFGTPQLAMLRQENPANGTALNPSELLGSVLCRPAIFELNNLKVRPPVQSFPIGLRPANCRGRLQTTHRHEPPPGHRSEGFWPCSSPSEASRIASSEALEKLTDVASISSSAPVSTRSNSSESSSFA